MIAVLGLGACSDRDGSQKAAHDAHAGTQERADSGHDTEKPSGEYVAMGSSFAAGVGIPELIPDQTCGRSTGNYAHLIAKELGLHLVDVSCSGTTSADITAPSKAAQPAQLDAVTSKTQIVTITTGGNDVGYASALAICGADGAKGVSCVGTDLDPAAVDELFATLEQHLVDMLDAVKKAAPQARVYLVGYPRILPDSGTGCPGAPMQPGDATFLVDMGGRLQAAFVAAAKAADVHYVDVYSASNDHDACASDEERWVEGQTTPGSAPYHPNAAGMRAQATLVGAEIVRTF